MVVEYSGVKYRIKELTFGEVLEYMEKSTKIVPTPSGELKSILDASSSALAIITLCVEVDGGDGRWRRMSEDEVKRMPARVAMKLVNDCLKVNDFLQVA